MGTTLTALTLLSATAGEELEDSADILTRTFTANPVKQNKCWNTAEKERLI